MLNRYLVYAVLLLSLCGFRMNKPLTLSYPLEEKQIAETNKIFLDIWNLLNGRMTEFVDDVTLSGNAKVTKYEWISAGAAGVGGAAPATVDVNDLGFVVLEFADAADDYAQANIKIPDDMDLSEDSYICVGWSVPNTSANMTWGWGYLINAVGDDTQPASATTGTTVVTSSSTADGLNVSTIVTIAGGTIASTDICIHIYVYRDVSEDTYGAEVDLHGMSLKFTSNKLGEAQ